MQGKRSELCFLWHPVALDSPYGLLVPVLGQIDAWFVPEVNGPASGWSDRAVGSTETAWGETKSTAGASVSGVSLGYLFVNNSK